MLGHALLLALASVTAHGDEPTPASDAETSPDEHKQNVVVRLIYTADRHGIGTGAAPDDLLRRLLARSGPGGYEVQSVHVEHGILVQGNFLLDAGGTMAQAIAFLNGNAIACGGPEPLTARSTDRDHLFLPGTTNADWAPGAQHAAYVRTCTHPSGQTALLVSSHNTSSLPDWQQNHWETRRALRGQLTRDGVAQPFLAVAQPRGDSSRSQARVLALQSGAERFNGPSTLGPIVARVNVDAGSFLDGASSVIDGALSLHRPAGIEMLAARAPVALVPGLTELVAGPASFFQEVEERGLPYTATNWATEHAHLELPPYVLQDVPTDGGDVRIAYVGVLDPDLHRRLPAIAKDGVTIGDPVVALQSTIDGLHALAAPPHAIVGLTTGNGALQEHIRREVRGLDLLIGDSSMATLRTTRRLVELRPLTASEKGAAVTLPSDGVASVDLVFDEASRRLAAIEIVPEPITPAMPLDPVSASAIMDVRARTYPALEVPLLPAPAEAPLSPWSPPRWRTLVCEATRSGSNADIAILDELPSPPPIPGPLTELAALDGLATLDTLEVHAIPGNQLQRLSDRLDGMDLIVCGISPGQKVSKVGPRWLDPDRVYTVVTTPQATQGSSLGDVLKAFESRRLLDPNPVVAINSEDGQAATLRNTSLQRFRALRDAPDVGIANIEAELLQRGPQEWEPLWLLRARSLGVNTQTFSGVDTPIYAAVPETLATSPSSFTFGGSGDLAIEYSGPHLWSDVRSQMAFTRIRAGDEDPEELADDLVLSTSHGLPGAAVALTPSLRWMPYTEVFYDSEWTPISVADGGSGLRQADLSLVLGIAALRTGPLMTLKTGGFVNRDMAQLDEKPPEYGGRLDWETAVVFGPGLKWTTTGAALLWANTPDDDPSDLRFRVLADTTVALPLSRALQVGVFAQGFALQGRTPANDQIGFSHTLGATLNANGAFRL